MRLVGTVPKIILSESPDHRTEAVRDAHDPAGRYTIATTYHDEEIASRNKKNRDAKKVKPGDPFPLHKGEVIYLFKANPIQWAHFKRQHPELVASLMSRDQFAREKAAADIKALHPEWVVTAPRGVQA